MNILVVSFTYGIKIKSLKVIIPNIFNINFLINLHDLIIMKKILKMLNTINELTDLTCAVLKKINFHLQN